MIYSHIEKKNSCQQKNESETIGLLKSLVSKEHQKVIKRLSAHEIWTTLKTKFKDTLLIVLGNIIQKAGYICMSNFQNPSLYCKVF